MSDSVLNKTTNELLLQYIYYIYILAVNIFSIWSNHFKQYTYLHKNKMHVFVYAHYMPGIVLIQWGIFRYRSKTSSKYIYYPALCIFVACKKILMQKNKARKQYLL